MTVYLFFIIVMSSINVKITISDIIKYSKVKQQMLTSKCLQVFKQYFDKKNEKKA